MKNLKLKNIFAIIKGALIGVVVNLLAILIYVFKNMDLRFSKYFVFIQIKTTACMHEETAVETIVFVPVIPIIIKL